MEVWKEIEGYPEYMISNFGRVKSLRFDKEKILKQGIGKYGYYLVDLWKEGGHKSFRVNRLVAQAFLPNPQNLPQVNHKNQIKTDNCVDNLEWCTAKQNCNHGTRNERIGNAHKGKIVSQETKDKIGKALSKSVVQIHQSGLIIGAYDSTKEASNELNIHQGNISSCLKNKRNSAGGFKFKYLNELKKAS